MKFPLTDLDISERIKTLVRTADFSIMTPSSGIPVNAFSGSNAEWDDAGSLCFHSTSDFGNSQLMEKVKLFYCNPKTEDYVSIYGDAVVAVPEKKVKSWWNAITSAIVRERESAPMLNIRKVKPTEAYYWDKASSRMVSMFHAPREPQQKVRCNTLYGEVEI